MFFLLNSRLRSIRTDLFVPTARPLFHILSAAVEPLKQITRFYFLLMFFTGEGEAKWLKDICLEQVQAGT